MTGNAINAKSEALELHELSSEELDAVSGGDKASEEQAQQEKKRRGSGKGISAGPQRATLNQNRKPLHKDGWYLRRSGGGSGGRCRSCLKTAKTLGLDVPTHGLGGGRCPYHEWCWSDFDDLPHSSPTQGDSPARGSRIQTHHGGMIPTEKTAGELQMTNTIPNDTRELEIGELDCVSGGFIVKGGLEGVCTNDKRPSEYDPAAMFQRILQQMMQGSN